MRKLTKEEFIDKSILKHKGKYDYSNVEFINTTTKIKIKCLIHDYEFYQLPKEHLSGSGCPKCGGNIKYTTITFIEKANNIHKNIYDYSKVKYINGRCKVEIICEKHGLFKQQAYLHLQHNGCPKCCKNHKDNLLTFIEKANLTHKNIYDYSLVKYKRCTKKIKIICRVHGLFSQKPCEHISGRGCPKCGDTTSNTDLFIEKAKLIHKDMYDYSKVKYKNNYTKVKIICKKHGIYNQQPSNHLSGSGCPTCNISKGEEKIRKILENKKIEFIQQKTFKNCKKK